MPARKIIVLGASAGGLEAMSTVLRDLPARLAAAVFVVIHTTPDSPSLLPEILARASRWKAKHAVDGERYRSNTIYVAPPDHHLTIEHNGTMRVIRGPRENRHRPAIDPLFRSAALAAGPDAIAVVLSGTLDDGTAGVIAVKERGGLAIVQDPEDAIHPGMPRSVIENAAVDHVLPAAQIANAIARAVAESRAPPMDGEPLRSAGNG